MPYQYEEANGEGGLELRGLDVEVARAASRIADHRVTFEYRPWLENLRAVETGESDFAMAATREKSREAWAWFSRPYRKESIYVYVRSGEEKRWQAEAALGSLLALRNAGGRLAVEAGYFYGPEVAALLAEPSERKWVIRKSNAADAVNAVLSGEADAVLADHLAGPSVAWDFRKNGRIVELAGPIFEADLCMMFSKKTVSQETLAAYNRALETIAASGELSRLTRYYRSHRLLLMTLGSNWFLSIEIIGTVAFAISGVIIARRENYDIIGASVLAFLPALGGGVLRDLISGRSPIGVLRSPLYIYLVLGTVLAGFLFFVIRDALVKNPTGPQLGAKFRWRSAQGLLEITDAMGLASFTIIGVMVAVERRCEPLWLWGPIMACLTGAGGGVLRDVLRARSDIPTLKGSVYPEIALIGGLFYSMAILNRNVGLNLVDLTLVTLFIVGAVFIVRLLVVHFGIRSLFLANPFKSSPASPPGPSPR